MSGFKHHPRFRLACLCDTDPAALKKAQAESEANTEISHLEEVLNDRYIDAVALFIPAPLHAEQSVAALHAGKHVISAVPVVYRNYKRPRRSGQAVLASTRPLCCRVHVFNVVPLLDSAGSMNERTRFRC